MDRPERTERDDAQKAKLIFFSLAALVVILLLWSVAAASKARSERKLARQEVETLRSENAKLNEMLSMVTLENESLKKKVAELQHKARPKAKPAAKKKTTSAKSTRKKKGH